MTKSKMRIYKDNDYSDQTVYLDMSVDLTDNVGLWIDTPNENIRLEADDIIVALWPRVYEIVYEHVQRALSND